MVDWLADARAIQPAELESVAYSHWDQDAAKHQIRVAAGLDSQVLGEPQIMEKQPFMMDQPQTTMEQPSIMESMGPAPSQIMET